MLRRSPLLLALALLGCHSPGSDVGVVPEPTPVRAGESVRREAALEQPSHLRLAWGTVLYAAPREDAIVLRLGTAEAMGGSQSAVAVVGREGDYWKVETVDGAALTELAVGAVEGLELYTLTLYVPIGVGESIHPIPPGPDTPAAPAPDDEARLLAKVAAESGMLGMLGVMSVNPPLQSGERRPAELATDFRVSPSSTVYWSDGREAGQVRREHAFVEAGQARASEVGPLRCFIVRVGPTGGGGDGELCFAEASVLEVAVVPEPEFAFADLYAGDAGLMWGEGIGDDYGVGGLGLTGTGVGGGGGGGSIGDGGGSIGTIGHGGGGSGSVSTADMTMGKVKVGGSMDADIARRIIRAQLGDLRRCWTDAGSPASSLELALEVDGQGNVTRQTASGSVAAIERCVIAAAKTWMFPESLAGTIALPLSFGDPPP